MKSKQKSRQKLSIQPATTPAGRENQLINEAYDLVEQQILDGTASAQVLVHFLRLATEKERYQRDKLKYEAELAQAKIKAIESDAHTNELYAQALDAMRSYRGDSTDNE